MVIHGIELAVVAIVAHAVLGMATSLCPTLRHALIALAAAAAALVLPGLWSHMGVLLGAALMGGLFTRGAGDAAATVPTIPSRRTALWCWAILFAGVAAALAILATDLSEWSRLPALCFQAGAFVFWRCSTRSSPRSPACSRCCRSCTSAWVPRS
ncbi:MAG: hypothetical protein H0V44_16160 [Planctomycetes bacterium]|nr:hypothetical protein [Planctomycetota bacterium]